MQRQNDKKTDHLRGWIAPALALLAWGIFLTASSAAVGHLASERTRL